MDLLINAARHFTDKRLFWVLHGNDPAALSDKARDLLATSRNSALLIGHDADSFFLNLLRELNVGVPEAIREPLFLAHLHATQLAQHDAAQIADAGTINATIERHQSEIVAMAVALDLHRKKQTATELALTKARELRMAGNRLDALRVLQAAAKRSKDIAVWQEVAEVAYEVGETSAEREPLEAAVAAWRQVIKLMEKVDRNFDRLSWAGAQNDLGNALAALGERESGAARLEEAVVAYRDALKERSRERVPFEWAITQTNLGDALRTLGERESSTVRLKEAVIACRDALREYTRQRMPLGWAATMNNLGAALAALGERERGTARLKQAVAAYRDALKEYTRERLPLDWAMTQNNLGNALAVLGARENGTARLEEAIVAYRESLKEYTRERVPLEWAMTLNNLGAALQTFGGRENGTARLEEAVASFRMALQEVTPQSASHYFDIVQQNLKDAEQLLAKRRAAPSSASRRTRKRRR